MDPHVLQGYIHICDLLGIYYCMNFPVHTITKKWVHNQLLNFSVHAEIDQIVSECTT